MKDGIVSAINPQPTPATKAGMVPSEIRNDNPTPTVVNNTVVMMIVPVVGKATRLMKL